MIRTISLRHSRRHLSTKSNDGAPGFGTKNCVSLNIIVILMLHNPARRRRAVDDSTDEDRRLRAIRVDQQSEFCLLSCVYMPPTLSVPSVRPSLPAALQTCRRHPFQSSHRYHISNSKLFIPNRSSSDASQAVRHLVRFVKPYVQLPSFIHLSNTRHTLYQGLRVMIFFYISRIFQNGFRSYVCQH